MALIECIANVSEGRRPAVVDACGRAIAGTGASLLDVHVSAAHHRSVFTFAGPAATLEAAAIALFDVAVASIDLRQHRGEHPRIGAVDVVPFVPLGETPMTECVLLARAVGAAVADRLGVPIYLYEEAATAEPRRRLEAIRRGQFEGLAARMREPGWHPDFGPTAPHPSAGASAIGARMPLIAYNVNLATDRIDVAVRIAKAVRESSGGLAALKAIGVRLADRGIVQVSMNLTDFRRTSMADAFAAVAAQAGREGVEVLESELVGLVPAAAVPPSPEQALLLRDFTADRVLETRIGQLRPQADAGPA